MGYGGQFNEILWPFWKPEINMMMMMGYTQDSNLTNSKPNPNLNPLMLIFYVTLERSLIHTNETRQPRKWPLFASKNV